MIDTLLPFLVVLTVLVFFHELGHYAVARWCGVRVEVFSIGFGPELFGWNDSHGTRWKVSLIPLGGYVRMYGDADASSRPDGSLNEMTPAEKAVSFHHKTVGQRAAVIAAGPAANFILALVLFAGLYSLYGQPYTPAVVGEVQEGSAAAAAGFEPGDRILAIDGATVERFEEVQRLVQLAAGEPLVFEVRRGDETVMLEAVPERLEVDDGLGGKSTIGRLGVARSGSEFRRHPPLEALWQACRETFGLTVGTFKALGQMIVGERSASELGGPIKIAQMSGEVASLGVASLIWFMALLSINLGLINLFPIPMLDGGHLVFLGIEALRGKPLGERAQEYGFRIGLALVLSLMVFATWNDLVSLRVFEFFRGLIT